MPLFGNVSSRSETNTSVSTVSVADSFNQAFNRVSDLSGVGNVSIAGEGVSGPSSGTIAILIAGLLGLLYLLRKKG